MFSGCKYDVQKKFNEWAEGKALTKDVIIHEVVIRSDTDEEYEEIAIFVYHPEGEPWEPTKKESDVQVAEALTFV